LRSAIFTLNCGSFNEGYKKSYSVVFFFKSSLSNNSCLFLFAFCIFSEDWATEGASVISDSRGASVIYDSRGTGAAFDSTGAVSDSTGPVSESTGAVSDTTGAVSDTTGAVSDTTGAATLLLSFIGSHSPVFAFRRVPFGQLTFLFFFSDAFGITGSEAIGSNSAGANVFGTQRLVILLYRVPLGHGNFLVLLVSAFVFADIITIYVYNL